MMYKDINELSSNHEYLEDKYTKVFNENLKLRYKILQLQKENLIKDKILRGLEERYSGFLRTVSEIETKEFYDEIENEIKNLI